MTSALDVGIKPPVLACLIATLFHADAANGINSVSVDEAHEVQLSDMYGRGASIHVRRDEVQNVPYD